MVVESHQAIANKFALMEKEIEELKLLIDHKESMLQEFKQETGDFPSLGHLKAHMNYLHCELEDKTKEVLE
jgi:hypothetical protein